MNKNGWGLRVELLFIVLFLVCLLIAVYGLNKLGLFNGPIDGGEVNYSYSELENMINDASRRYYQNNYSNQEEVTIYSSTLLSNGYITTLRDDNGNVCSGYTKVTKNLGGQLLFNSYINCPKYKTAGYTYE